MAVSWSIQTTVVRFKCVAITITLLASSWVAASDAGRDCLGNNDCASGQSCCNYLCVWESSCVGRDCSRDGQCGTNEHCCQHKCALTCDSCSSDSDCGSEAGDLICCNSACVNWDDCDGSLCSTDADCNGGDGDLSCCGGWCVDDDCDNYTSLYIGVMCGSVVAVLLSVFFYCHRRSRVIILSASRQPLVRSDPPVVTVETKLTYRCCCCDVVC